MGTVYDGTMIRRPKISLLIDDSSSEKYWSGTVDSPLFRFLSRRRHYNVFNTIINVHAITLLFG